MNNENTLAWSEELARAILYANAAHSRHGRSPRDAVRFHDCTTPYVVHPLWCAASVLQEPALPMEFRRVASVALLWHDVLEDTTSSLPQDASLEVVRLVEGMTFSSFDEEQDQVWCRTPDVKLLKLYDKVSNLLDGSWMKADKWNAYVDYTLRLALEVERHFSHLDLSIVKIARAVAVKRECA
jgi:(p)ppGpp synthase/HD superfamily hydrolase